MPRRASRSPILIVVSGALACLLTPLIAYSSQSETHVTGRVAVASVRHDWKAHAHVAVEAKGRSLLPVPANYAHLSPEARLAFLQARRNLNPVRFDHYHPWIGLKLAEDDRMKAAQSQNCMPMNGLLPDNSLTRYLQFRRGLNPVRFDFYHPTLGAILVEDQKLKIGAGCVAGELIPPPTTPTLPPGTPSPGPPTGGGPPPDRGVVPEPRSLLLVLLGTAGGGIVHFVRRARAKRGDTLAD
jgi:hypothetical protein